MLRQNKLNMFSTFFGPVMFFFLTFFTEGGPQTFVQLQKVKKPLM